MPMLHIESGKLYCTHCRTSYGLNTSVVVHPAYKNVGLWGDPAIVQQEGFLDRLKSCPNQGKWFQFPEAVQLMDKEPR